jgi:hypothetical protein
MNHRWAIAFVLVIFAGYTLGKDRALQDNAVAEHVAASPLAER